MLSSRRTVSRRCAFRRLLHESLESRTLLAADIGPALPEEATAFGEGEGSTTVYQEDFENGMSGFSVDNSGGSLPGLWHLSIGRRSDQLPNHSPIHSFYYGLFETAFGGGRYDTIPFDHQGTLISPPIQLGTNSELSFSYLLDTRLATDVDVVQVAVEHGGTITPILSRAGGQLVQTGNQWLTARSDLAAFDCDEVRLRFTFDTVATDAIDPEGWYVDDILITGDRAACTTGSITGHKFEDHNGNGVAEPGEPRRNGFEIHALTLDNDGNFVPVRDADGNPLTAITRDLDLDGNGQIDPETERGIYRFDSLGTGTYQVREVLTSSQSSAGWSQSSAQPTAIALSAGDAFVAVAGQSGGSPTTELVLQDLAIGNFLTGSLHGIKFLDLDENGSQNGSEPRLAGIEFVLTGPEGFQQSVTTNANGEFEFLQLQPGSYSLREITTAENTDQVQIDNILIESGVEWVAVAGQAGLPVGSPKRELILDMDANGVPDLAIPNIRRTGSIHGHKFLDLNEDGIENDRDFRLGGIEFQLTGPNGFSRSVLTNSNGEFDFIDLQPGVYMLTEVRTGGRPALTIGTIEVVGNIEWIAELGQANLPTGTLKREQILDRDGDGVSDLAVANPPASIHGFAFEDLNADGIYDATTEPGFSSTKFAKEFELIRQSDGLVVDTAMINSDGEFWFTQVEPDTYIIRERVEALPQDIRLSTPERVVVTVQTGEGIAWATGRAMLGTTPGKIETVDSRLVFGNYVTGSIHAYKFRDISENGQDENEPRAASIEFHLRGTDGTGNSVDLTATTDANGELGFTDLIPGTYSLEESTQATTQPAVVNPIIVASGIEWVAFAGQAMLPSGSAKTERILDANSDGVPDLAIANPGLDFGDAPAGFPTLLSEDGPRHVKLDGFQLGGGFLDAEPDGQPNNQAQGDDQAMDDEDGVIFPSTLVVGQAAVANVSVAQSVLDRGGRLDAWIDLNGDKDWDDPNERIASDLALSNLNTAINIPPVTVAGTTYARFRLSSTGVTSYTGLAIDGEVEDHSIPVAPAPEFDFGDAPAPFPTLAADNGARHQIVDGFHLGALIDAEDDGQPSAAAIADDQSSGDEDGVTGPSGALLAATAFERGRTVDLTVNLTNTVGNDAFLNAWIDFDQDNNWSTGEQVASNLALSPGGNILPVTVPATSVPGSSYVRFRLTSTPLVPQEPFGAAVGGEVEDYVIDITDPQVQLAGSKFNDVNSDGLRSTGEAGLGGWRFLVFAENTDLGNINGQLDQSEFDAGPIANITSDAEGLFATRLGSVPARFIVVEVMQDGWTQSNVAGPATSLTGQSTAATSVLSTGLRTGNLELGQIGYAFASADGEINGIDFGNFATPISKRSFLVSRLRGS